MTTIQHFRAAMKPLWMRGLCRRREAEKQSSGEKPRLSQRSNQTEFIGLSGEAEKQRNRVHRLEQRSRETVLLGLSREAELAEEQNEVPAFLV